MFWSKLEGKEFLLSSRTKVTTETKQKILTLPSQCWRHPLGTAARLLSPPTW
jgi:hypothetical protein